jgi:choline dehydrogenase
MPLLPITSTDYVFMQLSGKGYSVLIIEAGEDARWNPAVYNAEDRIFGSSFCNWKYTGFDEDGQELPTKIDSGRCIGGSTSSK